MKKNLVITAFLGILAIILGAFASHGLKEHLDPNELKSFETAVHYQMFHVLALLIVNMYGGFSDKSKKIISYLFFAGIVFFSGSIYSIYLFGVTASSIWFFTPLGGILFILGWIFLLISILQTQEKI
ncbi:MAG: DUF423 domain-containing protein [Flavobacteriaceae bacterium]|nr:DUF423 domain-containing protein [Flavobacteriaceae bacterium]